MKKLKSILKKWLKIDNNSWGYYRLKFKVGSWKYYLFRLFPVNRKKIVFVSFKGKYGGDPKYISDRLYQTDPTLDLVWLLHPTTDCPDSFVRRVRYGSWRAIYELVTAKVWVDDCRKEGIVRKRKSQFYIGTGHGGIPMKKIEKDAEDQLSAIYLLWAKNDSQMTDLKPSNSRWRNEMLRRAFWYDGEILNCGLPRVEYLIKNKPEKYAQIRKQYGLSEKTKIFLYAPTFRQNEEGELYNLDFQQTKKALEKRFGGEWIGFRRLHPVATQTQRLNLAGIVVDVTDYPDMEDLMLACDLLITDYSSCLFETFFLNIPAFLYVVDKELYIKKERGLYWEIDKLPFPKAISNQEMALQIETYDPKQYQSGLEDLKKTIGFFEDQTHATEQLVERIRIEQSK